MVPFSGHVHVAQSFGCVQISHTFPLSLLVNVGMARLEETVQEHRFFNEYTLNGMKC